VFGLAIEKLFAFFICSLIDFSLIITSVRFKLIILEAVYYLTPSTLNNQYSEPKLGRPHLVPIKTEIISQTRDINLWKHEGANFTLPYFSSCLKYQN
jgi:hypothetical protein